MTHLDEEGAESACPEEVESARDQLTGVMGDAEWDAGSGGEEGLDRRVELDERSWSVRAPKRGRDRIRMR